MLSSWQAPASAGYSLIIISLLTTFLLHFVHQDLRFMMFDVGGGGHRTMYQHHNTVEIHLTLDMRMYFSKMH